MGDLLGISGKYVGMIERGEKPVDEQSSLGLLFRSFEESSEEDDSRIALPVKKEPPLYRIRGRRGAGAKELPELPMDGDNAIAEGGSVRRNRGGLYESSMTSLSADSSALAAHLLKGMKREDVFSLLRDLTKAGEAGDEAALRKARALLEILPTTHPTTVSAGG